MTKAVETLDNYVPTAEILPNVGQKEILCTMRYLDLPDSDYFVIGGANLVLRGIKSSTPDLDMLVSEEVFDWLATRSGAELKEPPHAAILRGADNQTVWVKNSRTSIPISATTALGDGYYPMTFDSHFTHTEIIQDIRCLELEHIQAAKEALQRTKDIADLESIARATGQLFTVSELPTVTEPFPES